MRNRYCIKIQSLEGQQTKENQKMWLKCHLTEYQKVLCFAPNILFTHS